MIVRQTTKALFAESLKELAQFKPVDKITVKELAKNCGLTAPTFYNNFRDKYELAAWIYNQEFDAAFKNFRASRNFESFVYRCIEILFEDEIFFCNALKNFVGQNSFRYTTNDHAINLLVEWIKTRQNLRELPTEILFHVKFFMRAVSEFVSDWALGKYDCSPRQMAKFFVAAMPEPLKPILLQS